MAHSFIELDKAVVHVIRLVSFLWSWFQSVCPLIPSLSVFPLTGVTLTLDMGNLLTATSPDLKRGQEKAHVVRTSWLLAAPALRSRHLPQCCAATAHGSVTKLCQLCEPSRTAALQAPLSMGFFRRNYWSVLPFPFPGDLPDHCTSWDVLMKFNWHAIVCKFEVYSVRTWDVCIF